MAQLRQTPGSTPLTELHEPFMGYLQLGGLDSLKIVSDGGLHRRSPDQESPCW